MVSWSVMATTSRLVWSVTWSTTSAGEGHPSLNEVWTWRSASPRLFIRGAEVYNDGVVISESSRRQPKIERISTGGVGLEGLMQDYELTIQHALWRIQRLFARKEVV